MTIREKNAISSLRKLSRYFAENPAVRLLLKRSALSLLSDVIDGKDRRELDDRVAYMLADVIMWTFDAREDSRIEWHLFTRAANCGLRPQHELATAILCSISGAYRRRHPRQRFMSLRRDWVGRCPNKLTAEHRAWVYQVNKRFRVFKMNDLKAEFETA